MRRAFTLILLASSVSAGAAAAQPAGPALVIRDAAVRVVVTPEARADVQATLRGGSERLRRPTMRREGAGLVVDGGLRDRIRGCSAFSLVSDIPDDWNNPNRPDRHGRVHVQGVGRVPLAELPLLDVRVPLDARIEASGAVFGAVGRTRSLSLTNRGCGDWTAANTAGPLVVSVTGSGDVRAGTAARADVAVRGSGDVALAGVAGPLTAEVVGSGDVRARSVAGQVAARVRGSGDVRVSGGVAQGLTGEVHGSGDVRVAEARGVVRLATYGSGDAVVDAGRAERLDVEVRGSGDVRFGGAAGAVNARIHGSGDARVREATGPVTRDVRGSGELTVG